MVAVVGTWSFSSCSVNICSDLLRKGQSTVSCLTDAIADFEQDSSTGVCVVGCGGFPNRNGILQCDAAVMTGDKQFGAVAALEGIKTPIKVAERVLQSEHSFIVGSGALEFAKKEGFSVFTNEELLYRHQPHPLPSNEHRGDKALLAEHKHDTIGLIIINKNNEVAAGVSSSGKPYKLPGRVGDSPLPGSGLYADNAFGAAVATGDGDEIMKHCPSFSVVSHMASGCHPMDACKTVVTNIVKYYQNTNRESCDIALLAANTKGQVGAASTVKMFRDPLTGTVYQGFPFAVWTELQPTVCIQVEPACDVSTLKCS